MYNLQLDNAITLHGIKNPRNAFFSEPSLYATRPRIFLAALPFVIPVIKSFAGTQFSRRYIFSNVCLKLNFKLSIGLKSR